MSDEPKRDNLDKAYDAGWRECAKWANRADLIADIGSPAYEAASRAALHTMRAELKAAQQELAAATAGIREALRELTGTPLDPEKKP